MRQEPGAGPTGSRFLADDCMDAGDRVMHGAITDDCMDAGDRVMHGAITDDCMDAGGRATHGAVAEAGAGSWTYKK